MQLVLDRYQTLQLSLVIALQVRQPVAMSINQGLSRNRSLVVRHVVLVKLHQCEHAVFARIAVFLAVSEFGHISA